jgi:hypothetical protein
MSPKKSFIDKFNDTLAKKGKVSHIIVVVQQPNKAEELIINTQQLGTKVEYYENAYNDNFELKNNNEIKIIDYLIC